MALVLMIFCGLILIFWLWTKKYFNFWTQKGLAQVNGIFPFGSLFGVGFNMCNTEKYDNFYREFKGKEDLIGFYNFLSPSVLVISPDVVKTILVHEFSSFHSRGLYHNKVSWVLLGS